MKFMTKLTVKYAPLAVHLRVLDVGVLDGGVVVCDEQLLEELDGDRTLAHASISHHHQLHLQGCRPLVTSSATEEGVRRAALYYIPLPVGRCHRTIK